MSQSSALARRVVTRCAALLAFLLVALAPVPPAPGITGDAHADERADRWAGFRIPGTGHADGGWIGGYRIGTTPVFVTTPRKRPNRSGFGPARATADLAGPGATQKETARAAWILSKYGGYRDDVQAAAVDAAVLHLLLGKTWRVTARGRGAQRIRQARDSATVLRFARLMLRASRVSAGIYGATVTATSADVGGITSVTVSVTDGRGRPVAGLPVSVTSPEGGPAVASGGPVEAVTGDDGRALVRLAAPLAGWRTVTAHIGQVPEHRLIVRAPDRKAQAAVAEGGVKRTLVVSVQAPVRGPQVLGLKASSGTFAVGSPAQVVATVAGDGTPRAATGTLYGPAPTESAASCTGTPIGTVATTVAADGDYELPPLTPVAGGHYVWRVAVDGTATSHPASACGAPTKILARTTTGVTADSATAAPGEVGATGTVSGLTFGEKVTLTGTLAGPYPSPASAAADGCGTTVGQPALRTRVGNGPVHFTVFVEAPGLYAWQAQTSAGDLWLGSRSPCGGQGTMVFVE